MTLDVYIATITGNTEIRKQVQRTLMILDGLGVPFNVIDITLRGNEKHREFMRENASNQRATGGVPLPPQFFIDEQYLGNYLDFEEAVEDNQLPEFLRLVPPSVSSGSGDETGKSTEESIENEDEADDEEEGSSEGDAEAEEVEENEQEDEDEEEDEGEQDDDEECDDEDEDNQPSNAESLSKDDESNDHEVKGDNVSAMDDEDVEPEDEG